MPVKQDKLDKLQETLNKGTNTVTNNDFMNDFDVNEAPDFGEVKPASVLVNEDCYRVVPERFSVMFNGKEQPMLILNVSVVEGIETGKEFEGSALTYFHSIAFRNSWRQLKDVTMAFGLAEDFSPSGSNAFEILEAIGEELVENGRPAWVKVKHGENKGKPVANLQGTTFTADRPDQK